MHLIIHSPDKVARSFEVAAGASLIDVLKDAGETVVAPCGGAGTCKRCQVLVRDRTGMSHRLACQTPAEDGQEIILKNLDAMHIEGADRAHANDLAESTTTAARPCAEASSLGIAVDIGTTTMAAYLVDLATGQVIGTAGKVNPQATYGGDVIARIEAAAQPSGMTALCSLLRIAIDQMIATLCQQAAINPSNVERLVVVGNTVMEHFAAGLNPGPIGTAPFTPPSLFGTSIELCKTAESASKKAYLAPAIAGYVGGDITAGLHAAGMADREQLQLFIDIGTNGEMALGNRDLMICCATAAGPAFEGASIALGMPALPGAVCAVRLTRQTLLVDTIDNAPALGICGSGLLDAIACLLAAGLVDETGRMALPGEAERPLSHLLGTVQGQAACYLDIERNIYVTQDDVRHVQLAKAALRAGAETMLTEMGATCDDIGELALAGGFGMRMNPTSAAQIGLFPPALANRVRQLGNAAGQGAVAALFNEGRSSIERIARTCTYLELSSSSAFSEHYLDAMGFDD
ncbi:ASKHA domain-containing protein [Gordonibacter sp.]|uniref:ASKHA domain-containing protein n=1 Tax=Gordonibacter sp. TaxID=1968902 RepID=UPI002FCBEE55